MKVIIVGGGFAGLTLANALEQGGIDFVLLEARDNFNPVIGASIGLGPGAMRILDQFGAAQDVLDQVFPLQRVNHRDIKGSLIVPPTPSWEVVHARFGYPECILQRRIIIKAMLKTVKAKGNLLLNKRLERIDHTESGIIVHCTDGTSYNGDLVCGCDGVHSRVRKEMWRVADEQDPGYIATGEKTKMTAEYCSLYGISNPVPGFNKQGDHQNTYEDGQTYLLIVGEEGLVHWFVQGEIGRKHFYHESDFPRRFTKAQVEQKVLDTLDKPINEHLTFRAIWDKRCGEVDMVPMEEALFEKWTYGRIATVGDSAHKMTANHGQAGNNAIESATVLANQLKKLHDSGEAPTHDAITIALRDYQARRQQRIDQSCEVAAEVCRMQCLTTWKHRFTLFWLLPLMGDMIADQFSETVIGSEVLEYLPLPERSFTGTCGFNPEQGVGKEESRVRRAVKAAPLLLLSLLSLLSFQQHGDSNQLLPTYAIWLFEAHRQANVLTPLRLPAVFGTLALLFGPVVIEPWYYFFHWLYSPIENFAAADKRMTNVAYSKTVLPVVLLGALIPGIWPQAASWMTFFPAGIAVLQLLLVKTGLSTTDLQHDILHNQKVDLPYIRRSVYFLAGVNSIVHSIPLWTSNTWLKAPHFASTAQNLLSYGLLAQALWFFLLFHDLKKAGMTDISWVSMIIMGVFGVFMIGPTATLLHGWLWREDILASKKEKHAHTREKYGGKSVWELNGVK